jgi:hypothetical protein
MPGADVTLNIGMHVDIGRVLHVLAHELRTPAGIAHGYLRMLIEDRLSDPADRRRALEQTQKALTRVTELARESTELANWLETDHSHRDDIDVGALVERAVGAAGLSPAPHIEVDDGAAAARISTVDVAALVNAVAAFLTAAARELRTDVCTLRAIAAGGEAVDLLMGPSERLPALGEGPDAAHAAPLMLERGGMGLALVTAAVVLEAHGAIGWTANGSRATVGIRVPLKGKAIQ